MWPLPRRCPPDLTQFLMREMLGIQATLHTILEGIARMTENQAKLDADVQQILAATVAISAEIDALRAANPGVDFTGLDSAVASLQALVPVDPNAGA